MGVSSVMQHKSLSSKLRQESEKFEGERAEHCRTILDVLEKTTTHSVMFQPGDGRRKLDWKACCFSLGRSERVYFVDLVTLGVLPDELKPEKKEEPKSAVSEEKDKAKDKDMDVEKENEKDRATEKEKEKEVEKEKEKDKEKEKEKDKEQDKE